MRFFFFCTLAARTRPSCAVGGGIDTTDAGLEALFKKIDVDGSGSVSMSEMKSRITVMYEGQQIDQKLLDTLMSAADTNGDGEVDLAEVILLCLFNEVSHAVARSPTPVATQMAVDSPRSADDLRLLSYACARVRAVQEYHAHPEGEVGREGHERSSLRESRMATRPMCFGVRPCVRSRVVAICYLWMVHAVCVWVRSGGCTASALSTESSIATSRGRARRRPHGATRGRVKGVQ